MGNLSTTIEVLPEEQADETFRKELLEIVIDTSEYLGEAS